MNVHKTKFEKKNQFSGVPSRGLKLENKTYMYKLKTSFSRKVVEKVRSTIPKGIVGGFEFTALQRNLKEWHERSWKYVCEC